MSGDDLRRAAIIDDQRSLKEFLLNKPNVCSVDEFGLSSLHYAVWNGHVNCVKMLVMNPNGVNREGNRTSCLDLQSCVGYTALHLAALDCPRSAVRDITLVLLMAGTDPKLLDKHGNTAYKLAKDNENEEFVTAFLHYVDARKGIQDIAPFKNMFDKMKKDFCFFSRSDPPPKPIVPSKSKKSAALTPLEEAKFPVPNFVTDRARVGEKPQELAVPEHVIQPLVKTGFEDLDGVDALRCLKFAKEQAFINAARREKLAKIGIPQLEHIDIK